MDVIGRLQFLNQMINTVISKSDDNLVCHSVGLNGCLAIQSEQHDSETEYQSYSYKAVYSNKEVEIISPILATDKKLV